MSLSHDEVDEILRIIDRSTASEVRLEHGDFRLVVRRRDGVDAPPVEAAEASAAPPPADRLRAAPEAAPPAPSATAQALRSPLAGTFYRASAPDAAPFVEVGDAVEAAAPLCILDVMKVMNVLKSPCAGSVARIDAANEAVVAAGEALIWIEPT